MFCFKSLFFTKSEPDLLHIFSFRSFSWLDPQVREKWQSSGKTRTLPPQTNYVGWMYECAGLSRNYQKVLIIVSLEKYYTKWHLHLCMCWFLIQAIFLVMWYQTKISESNITLPRFQIISCKSWKNQISTKETHGGTSRGFTSSQGVHMCFYKHENPLVLSSHMT